MKPRSVSVSVVQMGDEQYVSVVFRLRGRLEKENLVGFDGTAEPDMFRVKESSRKNRQKSIQHTLESVEFDNDE